MATGVGSDARRPDRLPKWARVATQLLIDGSVLAAAFLVAYALRFDFEIGGVLDQLLVQLPLVVALQLGALWLSGASGVFWRYISLADLPLFLRATLCWTLPLLAARYFLGPQLQLLRLPVSIIVLDAVFAFGAVLVARVVRRSIHESKGRGEAAHFIRGPRRPVLLVGAGRAGVLSVREIRSRGNTDLDPVGFVDDDPLKVGSVIHGVPVLGTTADLPDLVAAHRPDHVVITIANTEQSALRRIVEICEQIPIRVRAIPGFYELLQGQVSIQRMRDLEPEDLLGRPAVEADTDKLRDFLTGKRVMVTGAGGSIGSELVRQIAVFQPQRMILIDRTEFALFRIERELRETWPELEVHARLGDVCDAPRMGGLLAYHQPQVVVHAAAHKHVTLLETQPAEALKNNAFGTSQLGELCGEARVEAFVLVSTDKAVRPTSVMGASKRIAEIVCQVLNERFETRFMTVRFGNVLGSTGSVVPIFAQQIRSGGPVTVTHEEMTRYFMSIPEASQLVLSAAAMGRGGEVFVLDMGTPVRIVELAEKMIRYAGFEPYDDIDIIFTGARPGEKLAEELSHSAEDLMPTSNPKIHVGTVPAPDADGMRRGLRLLQDLVADGDGPGIRRLLNQLLPEAQLPVPERVRRR